jgi:hypothetical protein
MSRDLSGRIDKLRWSPEFLAGGGPWPSPQAADRAQGLVCFSCRQVDRVRTVQLCKVDGFSGWGFVVGALCERRFAQCLGVGGCLSARAVDGAQVLV